MILDYLLSVVIRILVTYIKIPPPSTSHALGLRRLDFFAGAGTSGHMRRVAGVLAASGHPASSTGAPKIARAAPAVGAWEGGRDTSLDQLYRNFGVSAAGVSANARRKKTVMTISGPIHGQLTQCMAWWAEARSGEFWGARWRATFGFWWCCHRARRLS